MSKGEGQFVRGARWVVAFGMILWGSYSWWALARVQWTGERLQQSLHDQWPGDAGPRIGTREKLLATADELAEGRFWAAGSQLAAVDPPTEDQRALAASFLRDRPEVRSKLLSLTAAAREAETEGRDVEAVRDALALAFRASVENDEATVIEKLEVADRAFGTTTSNLVAAGPVDADMLARYVAGIEPAYRLSQELMIEGAAAAEKVLVLAAKENAVGRHGEALASVRLAAELLGVSLAPRDQAEMPGWFLQLADREILPVEPARAAAAVELAQAMATAEAPHETVALLVARARRRLDSGQPDASAWWATVALNALGMTDEAIATATNPDDGKAAGE